MTPTTVTLVEGTGGGRNWAAPGAPFRTRLEAAGFEVLWFRGWSLNVVGADPFARGHHPDWTAGGWALSYLLEPLPYERRNVICHSHGIAPVLYAIALAHLPIRRLVSVCSPVRSDLRNIADQAAPLIGRWRAISAKGGDPWQRAGALFDWKLGWGGRWRQAHERLEIPEVGHSRLLTTFLELWDRDGMDDFLHARQGPLPPATTPAA